MPEIQNLGVYLERMSATLYDKCWWTKYIPDYVKTVIDFGCGVGDLSFALETVRPNYYEYIGIDDNPEMIEIASCKYPDRRFYSTLDQAVQELELSKNYWPQDTILVLNSVLHEVFSYMPKEAAISLVENMFCKWFEYIAIRDMCVPTVCRHGNTELVLEAIKKSSYNNMWEQYSAVSHHNDLDITITEFFLKYRYVENWDRERCERYLWPIDSFIADLAHHSNYIPWKWKFSIPFIRDCVKRDFGIDFKTATHIKMLMH